MKNIHTNFMAEYILKLTGEYASANRIHDVLNLSLSFTYTLANNNKVRNRIKNGRTEYNMEDFIRNLELSYNNNVINNPLTKEDFEINNFNNWEARNDIEKEEAEKAKLAAEARELGVSPSEVASMDNVEELLEAKRAEEAKPKTEAEKLELTRKKALNKLDFYERVVRSVAREEAEVAGYYEIMGEEKARPSIMDEQSVQVYLMKPALISRQSKNLLIEALIYSKCC